MKAQISFEMLVSLSISLVLISLLFSYAYQFYSKLQTSNFSRIECIAQNTVQLGLGVESGYIFGVGGC